MCRTIQCTFAIGAKKWASVGDVQAGEVAVFAGLCAVLRSAELAGRHFCGHVSYERFVIGRC